jgi:hypothetical protein
VLPHSPHKPLRPYGQCGLPWLLGHMEAWRSSQLTTADEVRQENGCASGLTRIALCADGRELRQPALNRESSWVRFGTDREQSTGTAVLGERRSVYVNQILIVLTPLSRTPSGSAHSHVSRSFSRGIANDIRSTLRTIRPTA